MPVVRLRADVNRTLCRFRIVFSFTIVIPVSFPRMIWIRQQYLETDHAHV